MRNAEHPETASLTLTGVLAALSDPTRLALVQVLADGQERAWNQLRAPVAKSTLSHHLKVLRTAGVTHTRQEGTRCFVWLRADDLERRFPGLLDAVLAAAPPLDNAMRPADEPAEDAPRAVDTAGALARPPRLSADPQTEPDRLSGHRPGLNHDWTGVSAKRSQIKPAVDTPRCGRQSNDTLGL